MYGTHSDIIIKEVDINNVPIGCRNMPVILFGILGSYLFLHIWETILLKLGK